MYVCMYVCIPPYIPEHKYFVAALDPHFAVFLPNSHSPFGALPFSDTFKAEQDIPAACEGNLRKP